MAPDAQDFGVAISQNQGWVLVMTSKPCRHGEVGVHGRQHGHGMPVSGST